MSVTGLQKATAVVNTFLDAHFLWLPRPAIKEDPDWTTAVYHATKDTIFIPHYTDSWREGQPEVLIHEVGHVLAFNSDKPIEGFLAAMGADPVLLQNGLINEVFAEHFARAYVDGYDGHNSPTLVGRVPFDAAKMRAFCEGLRPITPVVIPTTTVVVPMPQDGLASHWYSQWAPDHVGTGDCVPTSLKMLLSLYGQPVPTIAALRERCDIDDDGVINLGRDAGITLDAARAALADFGIVGAAVLSRDVGFDDILGHVREGRAVMVFILYADIPGRLDLGFGGLHAVVLAGIDGARGIVLDPDNSRDVPALYALDDLRTAWDDGRTVGGGAFIPDKMRGGDMAFKDDPDAQQFKNDMLNWQRDVNERLAFDAHHKHKNPEVETGEPEVA